MVVRMRIFEALRNRVALMIGRAVVNLVDDSTKMQLLQLSILAGETRDRIERFQNYGFTSHPQTDAEAVIVCIGGTRDRAIAIAVDDRRYRLKNLAAGEVALYSDEGDYVKFKRGRIVEIIAGNEINITCPAVTITGDLTVTGTLTGQTEVVAKTGGAAVHLSTHTTTAVTVGAGTSGPPTPGS